MCKYLIRLDDACPTMDLDKWVRLENILDKYSIKPMVGIVPCNADPNLIIDPVDPSFWERALNWSTKGWAVALHGFNHVYITTSGGINPIHNRSEFAGVSFDIQSDKIKKGYQYLQSMGLTPHYFFAPSHTFDYNTLHAITKESDIRIISDTFALRPYTYHNLYFIPQQFGRFRAINIDGYFTFCFHPNEMNDRDFEKFEAFLHKYYFRFISFDQIDLSAIKPKSIFDGLASRFYFLARKIKNKLI